MKVLITGGAGYLGNELAFELLKHDDVEKIIIFDNLSRKNYNLFLDTPYHKGKVTFIRGELLDSRILRKIISDGVDVIYHLAARVTTPFANEDPHLFEQINHWGTAELIYATENSDVQKFIYLSSTSVYGPSENLIDINFQPNPKTFYGSSKLRAEEHVKLLFDIMPAYVIRCGNIYGYSPSVRFDAVINRFLFEANFIGKIQVTGNGNQQRAFIHIDRAANALVNILYENSASDTYNLVEHNISVNQIAATIKEIYPNLEIIYVNQHLQMPELKVQPDQRINQYIKIKDISFKEQLINFKNKFAFSNFS